MSESELRDLRRRIQRIEVAIATRMESDHGRPFATWESVGYAWGMKATTARNFVAKTLRREETT